MALVFEKVLTEAVIAPHWVPVFSSAPASRKSSICQAAFVRGATQLIRSKHNVIPLT